VKGFFKKPLIVTQKEKFKRDSFDSLLPKALIKLRMGHSFGINAKEIVFLARFFKKKNKIKQNDFPEILYEKYFFHTVEVVNPQKKKKKFRIFHVSYINVFSKELDKFLKLK